MGEGARRADEGSSFLKTVNGFHHAIRLTHMAHQTDLSRNRARTLRKGDTEAERRLWEELRNRRLNGFKFVRQLRIGPYFADFACRSSKLVVEVDGTTHGSEAEVRYDTTRTQFLEEQGWQVLRVWNTDVFTARNAVCDSILMALENRN
jgi:very-short-patch-repair endonuclease